MQQNRQFCKFFYFLLITKRSGLLAVIRWFVCMSKSHWSLCVSFSRTEAGLCIYQLFVWSNLNFLHIYQWIILTIPLCLLLYSFCANSLHLFIMWLLVSSQSPYNLHLLFSCVLSILALVWLVLVVFFFSCYLERSLIKFPFLRHLQVFSCEKLFISHLRRQ